MKPDNRFDTHNGEHRFEWDSGHRIEPVFEMTKAYIDELEASVEYLRKENIDWEDMYRELAGRYAKLNDLALMLHGCALGMADCDMCRRSNDGYACEYIMRELGVIE